MDDKLKVIINPRVQDVLNALPQTDKVVAHWDSYQDGFYHDTYLDRYEDYQDDVYHDEYRDEYFSQNNQLVCQVKTKTLTKK